MKVAQYCAIAFILAAVNARNVQIAITADNEWEMNIDGFEAKGPRDVDFPQGPYAWQQVQHLTVDLTPGIHTVNIHATDRGVARGLIASFATDGIVIGKTDVDGQWQASTVNPALVKSFKSVYDKVRVECNSNTWGNNVNEQINENCHVDDVSCNAKWIWPNDCGDHPFNEAWFTYQLVVPQDSSPVVMVDPPMCYQQEPMIASCSCPAIAYYEPPTFFTIGSFFAGLLVGLAFWFANSTIEYYRRIHAFNVLRNGKIEDTARFEILRVYDSEQEAGKV